MSAVCVHVEARRKDDESVTHPHLSLEGSLDTMRSFLQSRGYDQVDFLMKSATAGKEEATPGLQAKYDEILKRTADDIRDNSQQIIRDAHQSTQGAIDQTVNALDAATEEAVSKKGKADDSDKQWVDCIAGEKDLRVEVESAQEALRNAIAAWQTKRGECSEEKEAKVDAMCLFGRAYQGKCQALASYTSHQAEVDAEDGGEHSHPDRIKEWQNTEVVRCLLEKVLEGGELSEDSLAACEAAVNYDRDVGQLNKREPDVARLTEPGSFTCSEETIGFAGETWDVPAGEDPASSDYVMRSFAPQVSAAPGSAPFDFCPEAGPGKDAVA